MAYTTEKGKTRTNIYQDGEYVCQLMNKEVGPWLHRAKISDENDVWWEANRKVHRTAAVFAYLAKRTARGPVAVQLELI